MILHCHTQYTGMHSQIATATCICHTYVSVSILSRWYHSILLVHKAMQVASIPQNNPMANLCQNLHFWYQIINQQSYN